MIKPGNYDYMYGSEVHNHIEVHDEDGAHLGNGVEFAGEEDHQDF